MGGSGGGGGVLMVTDTDGTLDKTMGEIQDAYLAGKRVIILVSAIGTQSKDVIGIIPLQLGKGEYVGRVVTYVVGSVSNSGSTGSKLVLCPREYHVSGETEEAARNAYPVYHSA